MADETLKLSLEGLEKFCENVSLYLKKVEAGNAFREKIRPNPLLNLSPCQQTTASVAITFPPGEQ